MRNKVFNSLFWKVAAVFFIVVMAFSTIYLFMFYNSVSKYVDEVNQKLGSNIAGHTVNEIKPFVNGKVNEQAIHDIMHSMMVINPGVEVYLISPLGEIITYVAPYKVVKRKSIDLAPIQEFLIRNEGDIILGDNPREIDKQSIFSAAPVEENGELLGYVYIVLASQEYSGIAQAVFESTVLKVVSKSMLAVLLFAVLIGLLAVWFLTRNINIISEQVRKFKDGDLSARINLIGQGEFSEFANTFNNMAVQIERNVREIKTVEKLRRDLIANVSHDLRSPISSILGYIETVLLKLDSIEKEEIREYLTVSLKNGKQLDKLINDLFQLSKLEARETQLKAEPIQLSELIIDIANNYKMLANKRDISINTVLSENLPLVNVDVALLDRVFQNIMDNALKFCKSGDSINIELNLKQERIEVKVSDTGEGISEIDLPHIFDRHYQSNAKKESKGNGLGLAIVKKILDLHKAEINVQSQLHRGTTFSFALPLHS